MNASDRNPLREGAGKGDKPRHDTKKYRENFPFKTKFDKPKRKKKI